jgi:hypothetical protein
LAVPLLEVLKKGESDGEVFLTGEIMLVEKKE